MHLSCCPIALATDSLQHLVVLCTSRNHQEKKSNCFPLITFLFHGYRLLDYAQLDLLGHCLKSNSPLEMGGSWTDCLEDYPCQYSFRSKMQNCLWTKPFFPQVQFLRQWSLTYSKLSSDADLKITAVEQMTLTDRKAVRQILVPAASLTSYVIGYTNWLTCL